MNKEKEISFKLKGIELLEVCLKNPKEPLVGEVNFNYNISLEHRINTNDNLVVIIASVEILNNDKSVNYGSLKASCIFEIMNISEFINKEDKQLNMPNEIMITLNSISISTVRGIMFSEFRGTFLHNACLPIIDPKGFTVSK
jgi:preprotein translocase subunit SecB